MKVKIEKQYKLQGYTHTKANIDLFKFTVENLGNTLECEYADDKHSIIRFADGQEFPWYAFKPVDSITFDDIPKLRGSRPMYHVTTSLAHLHWNIDRYLEEYALDMCPNFQRGHVWTESQQIAYIEYVLRGGKSGKEVWFNYPGWDGPDHIDNARMVCVDGLQRITAVNRFNNNEIKAFGRYKSDYYGVLGVNDYTFDIYVNDIIEERDVIEWYLEMNSGGTPHSAEELDRVRKLIKEM